jgi:hypothetical protein
MHRAILDLAFDTPYDAIRHHVELPNYGNAADDRLAREIASDGSLRTSRQAC